MTIQGISREEYQKLFSAGGEHTVVLDRSDISADGSFEEFSLIKPYLDTGFEIEPTPVGGFRLVDSETGEQLSLRISKEICEQYKARYAIHSKRIIDLMSRYNGKLITIGSDQALKDSIMMINKQTGLIGFRL